MTKAIDCLVNVNMGDMKQPGWMTRVKEDYFKAGDTFFKSPELSELIDDVASRVSRATQARQTPWIARREMFGDFRIANAAPDDPVERPRPPAVAAPQTVRDMGPTVDGELGGQAVSTLTTTLFVQRVVRQSFGRIRACYDEGRRRLSRLSGVVKMTFVIGATGAVASASSDGSTLLDKAVVDCVTRTFAGLTFAVPKARPVRVVYPIEFQPETPDAYAPPARHGK